MAVKASAHITLSLVVEIEAYYRYYLLQASPLSKPSKPTTNPPGGSWTDAEPTYTAGSTNSLYFVDLTVFSNGTWSYSEVSLSSSYEAAKEAYNKAANVESNLTTNYYTKKDAEVLINAAEGRITSTVASTYTTKTEFNNLEIGGRNLLLKTKSEPSLTGKENKRWSGYGECLYVENYYDDFCAVHVTDVWSGVAFYLNYFTDVLSVGDEITFSVDIDNQSGVNAPVSFYLMQHDSDGNRVYVADVSDYGLGEVPSGETKRMSFTWTFDQATLDLINNDGTSRFTFQISTADSYDAYFYAPKLEKGNKVTDWTPAPEDVDADIDSTQDLASELRGDLGTLQSDLASTQSDVTSLQNGQASTLELVSKNTEKITELVQTTSGWEYNFTTIEKSVKELNDQIVTDKDEQYKYIRFIYGEIWIGKLPEEGEDDLQLVMRNDRISFLLNNVEIAYFSDDALYVTNIHVTNSLRIGNWEFAVRPNGNLGLRWVGE